MGKWDKLEKNQFTVRVREMGSIDEIITTISGGGME